MDGGSFILSKNMAVAFFNLKTWRRLYRRQVGQVQFALLGEKIL